MAYRVLELGQNWAEGGGDSGSTSEDDKPAVRYGVFGCICCAFIILALIVTNIILINLQSTCGEAGMGWNEAVPASLTSQMQYKFASFFWHQVNVFDSADDKQLGHWQDLNLLFDIQKRFAFVRKNEDGDEAVQVEARSPFGLYFGTRYNVWRCAGTQEHEYSIEEDYWSRPWFNWNAERKYTIKDLGADKVIATSEHHKDDVLSFRGAHWEATVSSPDGEKIATISQQSQAAAGWFQYAKWTSVNLHSEIVPNEVVSFLAAVYDIENAQNQEKNKK